MTIDLKALQSAMADGVSDNVDLRGVDLDGLLLMDSNADMILSQDEYVSALKAAEGEIKEGLIAGYEDLSRRVTLLTYELKLRKEYPAFKDSRGETVCDSLGETVNFLKGINYRRMSDLNHTFLFASFCPDAKLIGLFERAATGKWTGFYEAALSNVGWLPLNTRTDFIRHGMNNGAPNVRRKAAYQISAAPVEDRTRLISEGLFDSGWYGMQRASWWGVREVAASQVWSAPEADRLDLIKKGMLDEDHSVRCTAIKQIEHVVSEDSRTGIINTGLNDKEENVREVAVLQIKFAPKSVRTVLVEKGLSDPEYSVRAAAAGQIGELPIKERALFIRKALSDKEGRVRRAAIDLIGTVPPEEMPGLIRKGLVDERMATRQTAAWFIAGLSGDEQAGLTKMAVRCITSRFSGAWRWWYK